MKTIVTLITALAFFANLSAQTDSLEKKTVNGYMVATYIFEGKVDSSKYFTIKTGQYSYVNFMAYLIDVTKVIKGNVQMGTIEVFQNAPGYTYKGPDRKEGAMQIDDGPPPPTNQGLYFCFDETTEMSKPCFTNSNSKTLRYFDDLSASNGIIKKDPRGRDLSQYFSTLSDFYNYISANYGIKIEDK